LNVVRFFRKKRELVDEEFMTEEEKAELAKLPPFELLDDAASLGNYTFAKKRIEALGVSMKHCESCSLFHIA